MKLLTADQPPDGEQEFCFTIGGELLYPVPPCDAQVYDPQPWCSCGCTTGWVGIVSRRGTTAAVVAEVDLDRSTLVELFLQHVADLDEQALDDPLMAISAGSFVDSLLEVAAAFPVGTRVRRNQLTISSR